jgi:hypothetical protein
MFKSIVFDDGHVNLAVPLSAAIPAWDMPTGF